MWDRRIKIFALSMTALALLAPLFFLVPADAEPETVFEGTVTDYVTGEPLEEAYVTLMDGKRGVRAMTDENGYYKIELDKGGTYSLVADKENYYDELTEEIIIFGETNTVDFELKPYKNFVTGRITDSSTEEGIEDAYVEFRKDEVEIVYGYSDADGNYKIGIQSGTYELKVRATNYQTHIEEDVSIEEGSDNVKDVSLEMHKQGIFGVVSDEDGNLVEGAQVFINGMGGSKDTYTDENGYYEIYLRAGNYKVNINKGGYTTSKATVDVPPQEMVEKDWTLYHSAPKSFIMRLIEWIWTMIGMDF